MRVVVVKSLCFTKATLCVGKKLTRDKDEHNSLILADSRLREQSTDEIVEPEYRLGNHQERDNWTHNGLDLLGNGL